LTRSDAVALRKTAHALKSSSANLGAMNLSSLLKELEAMGKLNTIDKAPELLAKIETEYGTVQAALREKLGGRDGNTS